MFVKSNSEEAMNLTVNDATFVFLNDFTTPKLEALGLKRKFTGKNASKSFIEMFRRLIEDPKLENWPELYKQSPIPGIITLA